jgi:hypothetical protein
MWYCVARRVDDATSQPVQKMTFDRLLPFVAKQQRLTREVFTCPATIKNSLSDN